MTRLEELKFSIALLLNLCGGWAVWLIAGVIVRLVRKGGGVKTLKVVLASVVLSVAVVLLAWFAFERREAKAVYMLRLDGTYVPAETYVGALNEPGFGGGLGFWGENGRSQAIEAAKTMRRKGWPCSVMEISGPAKIVYQEVE